MLLSPEQSSKKFGWEDPVTVRQPVEVVEEKPDSLLRDKLNHDK